MSAGPSVAGPRQTAADGPGVIACSSDLLSVPFHKLSQWLTYSLMEPFQKILGCEIEGVEQMTGEFGSGSATRFRGDFELNQANSATS